MHSLHPTRRENQWHKAEGGARMCPEGVGSSGVPAVMAQARAPISRNSRGRGVSAGAGAGSGHRPSTFSLSLSL